MLDRFPGRLLWFLPAFVLLWLLSCGSEDERPPETAALAPSALAGTRGPGNGGPIVADAQATSALDLSLHLEDVTVAPLPLQASDHFTVTAVVHNRSSIPALDVPVLFHILAEQERVGYAPFLDTIAVSVPPSQSVPIHIPVQWNLAGGEHQIWIEVNRLPETWREGPPAQPEVDLSDNAVLLELMVNPFDAYTSDLCRGRVDVEVGPADVVPDPTEQRIRVRVHNIGNRAVYNVPVVVLGRGAAGVAYTPAIPPCGGTAEVSIALDRTITEGEALTVQVNPSEWVDGLAEDDLDNNRVTFSVGLSPGMVVPPGGGLDEYDFRLEAGQINTPEPWIVEVTVHNRGTRDAAMVPIRVENEAGRRINDAIPLVRGGGLGVAALRVGYLWTRGGTLTFTVNPADAKGAYPEAHRDDNTATFVLP